MATRFWCCCIALVLLLSSSVPRVSGSRWVDAFDFLHKNGEGDKPWFCHSLDCPSYKVVNKTDHYEVREYASAKYVSTSVHSFMYEKALLMGFKRLFDYISGANEDQVKIAMTAPVLVKVQPGAGPFCESNFTVSFFVPSDYQNKTPVPTHEEVFISKLPAIKVYVIQFGGFAGDLTVTMKARELAAFLKKRNVDFDDSFFYTASYDPPFRLFGRHNEVWIAASDSAQAVAATRMGIKLALPTAALP